MPLREQLSRLRSNILTEEEEFGRHIRKWMPISVGIGILVGAAMSLFTIFTNLVANLVGGIPTLLAMTIGGLIVWFLVKIGFEDPSNNGISYVIKKRHEGKPVPLSQTQEFVSAGVAIGTGLPVGREGPALIIGSAIASQVSKWGNIPERELHDAITIGSAAATGALFQAPFGSAVFAAEVPYKEDSDEPMLVVAFLASVVAAVTLRTIILAVNNLGLEVELHLFRLGEAVLEINIINSVLAIVLGLMIGLGGKGIIDIYYRYQKVMRSRFDKDKSIMIGLIISLSSLLIGFVFIDNFYLTSNLDQFGTISDFASSSQPNLLLILFLGLIIQIIATIAIIAVGFPGGIFSPSLAIGALSGIIFATVIGMVPVQVIAFAIVGMSASHAAFTKTPIASILLVLEVTNLPNLIIPMILANISAYIISGHKSLYEGQIRSRDASLLKQVAKYDQFQELEISEIMTPLDEVITTSRNAELRDMYEIAQQSNKRTFPVIEDEKVIGIISYNDIIKGLQDNKSVVEEIMTIDVVTIQEIQSVREALVRILQNSVERAPVVDKENYLRGMLTLYDILEGHHDLINYLSEQGDQFDY